MADAARAAGTRFWATWIAALLIWVAGLVLASPHDLTLAERVHTPGSAVAWAVFYLAEVPSWAVFALSLFSLVAHRRGWRWPRVPVPLAAAVVLLMLIYPLAVTRSLKLLWGRVRFEDLVGGEPYTPFYRPAGPGAGQSFPSGHVAMSLLWVPVPFYLWTRGERRRAVGAALLVLGYGALVVWGRMLAGDHYLTDGLFSAGAMLLLGPVLLRWTLRRWSARADQLP